MIIDSGSEKNKKASIIQKTPLKAEKYAPSGRTTHHISQLPDSSDNESEYSKDNGEELQSDESENVEIIDDGENDDGGEENENVGNNAPADGEDEEDFEFDFSRYENEDTDEQIPETITAPPPKITGYRARYAPWQAENERLSELRRALSQLAIKVRMYSQDLPTLWEFLGTLMECWQVTCNIYGSYINAEIKELEEKCISLLNKYNRGSIPQIVHNRLKELYGHISRIHQVSNLSFDIERVARSGLSRARRKIIE